MKKITVREIMKFGPCDRYNIFTVFKLIKFGKTPLEILDLEISKSDKFWLLLRPKYISERQLHLLACDFAQEVVYLNSDPGVQAAIDAKRLWIDGKITDEELKKARAAARAAYAATYAAYAAAAARAAAYAARAAYAADAADAATYAANAAYAATYAADAAAAAAYAAYAATYAADAATYAADVDIETKQIEMVKQIFIDMEVTK